MVLPCIILNYRGIQNTEQCLSSLLASTKTPLRIFVVDNGSGPAEQAALERLPFDVERLNLPQNMGFAKGMNMGIRVVLASNPTSILLLNNDTTFQGGAVDALVRVAEEVEEAGIVVPNRRFHRSILRDEVATNGEPATSQLRPREVKRAAAFCWLVNANVFSSVGLFDEEFFFGREDDDFCRRVTRFGYSVIEVPNSLVYHKLEGSDAGYGQVAASRFRLYHMSRGRGLYLRKHYDRIALFALTLLALASLARDITASTLTKGFDPRGVYLAFRGFADGLAGRNRVSPNLDSL